MLGEPGPGRDRFDRRNLPFVLARVAIIGSDPQPENVLHQVRRIDRECLATLLWLRAKEVPISTLSDLLRRVLGATPLPVLVGHRPDIAARAGAFGVQLGWSSPSIAAARSVVGVESVIGVSVHGWEEGCRRAEEGADFLVLGPILPTPKPTGKMTPLGLEGLRELTSRVAVPVVAVGGMGPEHAQEVKDAGGTGFAAIRAFTRSGDLGT